MSSKVTLIYVYDPMCSWCWGFSPTWHSIRETLELRYTSDLLSIRYLAGGLAPDSREPMPVELAESIRGYWRTIEQTLGTPFNHDFWTNNVPRRSTHPACRAVIAARELSGTQKERDMLGTIQQAYYLKAQNPSNLTTLVGCAEIIGLDRQAFERLVQSPECDALLQYEVRHARSIGAKSFPSLFIEHDEQIEPIALDYKDASVVIRSVEEAISL